MVRGVLTLLAGDSGGNRSFLTLKVRRPLAVGDSLLVLPESDESYSPYTMACRMVALMFYREGVFTVARSMCVGFNERLLISMPRSSAILYFSASSGLTLCVFYRPFFIDFAPAFVFKSCLRVDGVISKNNHYY